MLVIFEMMGAQDDPQRVKEHRIIVNASFNRHPLVHFWEHGNDLVRQSAGIRYGGGRRKSKVLR